MYEINPTNPTQQKFFETAIIELENTKESYYAIMHRIIAIADKLQVRQEEKSECKPKTQPLTIHQMIGDNIEQLNMTAEAIREKLNIIENYI